MDRKEGGVGDGAFDMGPLYCGQYLLRLSIYNFIKQAKIICSLLVKTL